MPKEVKAYACSICGKVYEEKAKAIYCEGKCGDKIVWNPKEIENLNGDNLKVMFYFETWKALSDMKDDEIFWIEATDTCMGLTEENLLQLKRQIEDILEFKRKKMLFNILG